MDLGAICIVSGRCRFYELFRKLIVNRVFNHWFSLLKILTVTWHNEKIFHIMRLILILVLTLSFQSWIKADDINDFEIYNLLDTMYPGIGKVGKNYSYGLRDEESIISISPSILFVLSARSSNGETIDNLRSTSIDYYSSLRSIYLQNRGINTSQDLENDITHRLGDTVMVEVIGVDLFKKEIDFRLV